MAGRNEEQETTKKQAELITGSDDSGACRTVQVVRMAAGRKEEKEERMVAGRTDNRK